MCAAESSHAGVVDAINEFATPSFSWLVGEVGWFYTPELSYTLDRIETKFREADGRTVTLQLFKNFVPGVGGTLLRTGDYSPPLASEFSGASFPGLAIEAGTEYFVGFQNTFELGANITAEADATSLGALHSSLDITGLYGNSTEGRFDQPIIRFIGAVPEPATVILLGLGLVALGFGTRMARRRPPGGVR